MAFRSHSLPLQLPLFEGRIFGSLPTPGDVVVFKKPPAQTDDYIKRAIALPGDVVQMRGGVLEINGKASKKCVCPTLSRPCHKGCAMPWRWKAASCLFPPRI